MSQSDSELLRKVYDEHKLLAAKVESAFPKDDNGEIDFAEHRLYHRKQHDKIEDNTKARAKLISAVTTWAVIGILTIIGNALVHAYIIPLLPLLSK